MHLASTFVSRGMHYGVNNATCVPSSHTGLTERDAIGYHIPPLFVELGPYNAQSSGCNAVQPKVQGLDENARSIVCVTLE